MTTPFDKAIQELKSQISDLEGELSDAGCEIKGLKNNIYDLEEELCSANDRILELEKEVAFLRATGNKFALA